MSEREILQRWLTSGAQRERIGGWLHAFGSCACVLAGALLLLGGARALSIHPAVAAALAPLLLMVVIGGCALAVLHALRRIDAQQAARLADTRAGLHDQLTSAHWFASHPAHESIVDLLLRQAARSVQQLDLARIFPLRLPRRFALALGLSGLALALALITPGRVQQTHVADDDRPVSGAVPARALTPAPPEEPSAAAAAAQRAAMHDEIEIAARVETLAAALGEGADVRAVRAALTAGDPMQAARLLESLARRLAMPPSPAQAAAAPGEQMSAEVAASILERVQQLLREQGDSDPAPAPATQGVEASATLTRQLREEMSAAPPQAANEQSLGEAELNRNLRALARNSRDPRNAIRGEGAPDQEGGNANSGGGAMGRRVGVSRAGAGDGDQDANANPTGDAQAEDVLGARTQRLQAQLQQVKVESDGSQADDDAAEDPGYVLTQWEAAQRAYQTVQAQAQRSRETRSEAPATPLAYRESVKRYSLAQHRRETVHRSADAP